MVDEIPVVYFFRVDHTFKLTMASSTFEFPTDTLPFNQGVGSKTFKQPPLDGTLALHQLYDYNAEHSPKHPLYVYDSPDGDIKRITWGEARPAIHRAAKFAMNAVGSMSKDSSSPMIVGILANAGKNRSCQLIGILAQIFVYKRYDHFSVLRYWSFEGRLPTLLHIDSKFHRWRCEHANANFCNSFIHWRRRFNPKLC